MWMWAEACELLDRAERLQRQFFRPASATPQPVWEPPIDVFETPAAYWIVVALPGVRESQLEVRLDGAAIVVAGERHLPLQGRAAVLYRLEIPHGRFERRIELPSGRFQLGARELADGCLVLSLEKLG
jgi:HSP20 family molecular chaperone IbpA